MKLSSLAIATAFAAATLGTSTQVQAQDNGFFLDGRIGQSNLRDVPGSRRDTAYAFGAGYWFNRYFAVEGGWADLHDKRYAGGKIDLDGFYGGLKGRAMFDRGDGTGFFLGGRGGLFRWDVRVSVEDDVFDYERYKDSGTDWYAGVFTGYQITRNTAVSLNYDRFRADDVDTDLISVGFEYKF